MFMRIALFLLTLLGLIGAPLVYAVYLFDKVRGEA